MRARLNLSRLIIENDQPPLRAADYRLEIYLVKIPPSSLISVNRHARCISILYYITHRELYTYKALSETYAKLSGFHAKTATLKYSKGY